MGPNYKGEEKDSISPRIEDPQIATAGTSGTAQSAAAVLVRDDEKRGTQDHLEESRKPLNPPPKSVPKFLHSDDHETQSTGEESQTDSPGVRKIDSLEMRKNWDDIKVGPLNRIRAEESFESFSDSSIDVRLERRFDDDDEDYDDDNDYTGDYFESEEDEGNQDFIQQVAPTGLLYPKFPAYTRSPKSEQSLYMSSAYRGSSFKKEKVFSISEETPI